KPDRSDYLPREEGKLTLTVRDHEGKPVAAELALGLVDESVYYIQQDYAGDPRQFYFGQKRAHEVQTHSTFEHKSDERLRTDKGKLAGLGASFGETDGLALTRLEESEALAKSDDQDQLARGGTFFQDRFQAKRKAGGLKDLARARAPAALAAEAKNE